MDPKVIALLVICIAVVLAAGCMTQPLQPASPPPLTATLVRATPAGTALPLQGAECTSNEDCVPSECCHPSRCVKKGTGPSCNGIYCTMVCSGPLDCGAGSCGCVNGRCIVVPGSSTYSVPGVRTSLTVKVSPRQYSPMMSSTPGIGIDLTAVGFNPENASFAWKASYGQFLSWNSPDFKVNQLGDSASNHGEKLYWSFIEKPVSTKNPVTITVTATDTGSGLVLGSSTVTLTWDGDYAVTVQEIE